MSLFIQAKELASSLGSSDLVIFDTRFDIKSPQWGKEEYLNGHIPGAHYLDLEKDLSAKPSQHGGRHPLPDTLKLEEKLKRCGLNNDSQVVIYDQGTGVYAGRLWFQLRLMGLKSISLIDGGMGAWKEAQLPLSSAKETHLQGRFKAVLKTELIASRKDILPAINKGFKLIDARSAERFRGESEPLDPHAGHIPGASNYFWKENLDPSGKLKSPNALQAQFQTLGLKPEDKIIAYCGSGVSANHVLMALEELGYSQTQLYVGSWSDWCSYGSFPLAKGE